MFHALVVLMLSAALVFSAALQFTAALKLSAAGVVAAQSPTPRKASPPKTVRDYVFYCGMLTISTEGVTRNHGTQSDVG